MTKCGYGPIAFCHSYCAGTASYKNKTTSWFRWFRLVYWLCCIYSARIMLNFAICLNKLDTNIEFIYFLLPKHLYTAVMFLYDSQGYYTHY